MSRRIQGTPTIRGRDATRLQQALAAIVCTTGERKRRAVLARMRREAALRAKGRP